MHNLGCVIISNSDDLRFLSAGLLQIAPIFKRIVISIGTKLWNGEPQNNEVIDTFAKTLQPHIKLMKYCVPEDQISIFRGSIKPEMYWEGHARLIAYNEMNDVEYVMFLDSDEIIDGAAFKTWLDTYDYKHYGAMKLQNYWYWREPIYRAKNYHEDSIVLAKKGSFNPFHVFSNLGRHGIFESCAGRKMRDVTSVDKKPMAHHYSWVRDKENMLRKVRAWGHRNDRTDWSLLVEKEFSRPFNGTDFLKMLQYDIVEDTFGIA